MKERIKWYKTEKGKIAKRKYEQSKKGKEHYKKANKKWYEINGKEYYKEYYLKNRERLLRRVRTYQKKKRESLNLPRRAAALKAWNTKKTWN